jgi:aspartate--ammonia ligase
MASSKMADLAGPGIGNYTQLEKVLPNDYSSALTRRERQKAIFAVKRFIEDNLCKELNLIIVTVPLIVDVESGVNDMLDRDGSRTPIRFHIINDHNKHPVNAQIVQAATKWKRTALKQFGMRIAEACAPICAPFAKTIPWIMITASTSISGTGNA